MFYFSQAWLQQNILGGGALWRKAPCFKFSTARTIDTGIVQFNTTLRFKTPFKMIISILDLDHLGGAHPPAPVPDSS